MSDAKDEADSPDAPLGYWEDAARPLTALVFLLPLLVVYEVGLILSTGAASRNAADIWLRHLLEWFGLGHYFVLPLVTAGLLLAWHHLARYPWRFSVWTPVLMVVETLFWAVTLAAAAKVIAMILAGGATPLDTAAPESAAFATFKQIVLYIGAGVYEELLFRVLLLPAVAGLIHLSGVPRSQSYLFAAILTAIGFALAHYLPGGETFVLSEAAAWHRLIFRTLAGGFFAALFLWRGFGIAAGVHVVYDILTIWL